MTSIATSPGIPAGIPVREADAPAQGFLARVWRVVLLLRENLVANVLVIIAIVIGFLHGWLKLKYPYAWMTFIYDVPLVLALGVTLSRVPRGKPWFPVCGLSTGIKILIGCCVAWGFMPFDIPPAIAIASFRGWCFAPLMFLLGYHLCRTVRQVEIFMWVVLIMGLATAVYGIFFQSMEEVLALMKQDPEMQLKLGGNFYATSTGSQFRRFSTFVSASVFGVTMAGCVQFATSRFFLPGCSWIERIILLACSALCSYGVVISGSRTSMIALILSLLLTGAVRTGRIRFLMLPAMVFGALYYGISQTDGGVIERFGTLMDFDLVWGRIWIVISPSMNALLESPLGGGLGRAGHGVPAVFANLFPNYQAHGIDGDVGRLIVDMGVVGVGVYAILLYHGTKDSLRWMWKLRKSSLGVIGVPAGAWFILSLLQVPTGSPYLAIPFGTLTWLFVGALRRMVEEYDRLQLEVGEDVESLPQFASFIHPPRMTTLFQPRLTGPNAPAPIARGRPLRLTGRRIMAPLANQPAMLTVSDPSRPGRPEKRFLFRRGERPPR